MSHSPSAYVYICNIRTAIPLLWILLQPFSDSFRSLQPSPGPRCVAELLILQGFSTAPEARNAVSTRSRVHERILATNLLPPSSKICNCRVQICPNFFATIAVVGPTQAIISSGTHTRLCALPHAGHCPSSRMSLEQEKKRDRRPFWYVPECSGQNICQCGYWHV